MYASPLLKRVGLPAFTLLKYASFVKPVPYGVLVLYRATQCDQMDLRGKQTTVNGVYFYFRQTSGHTP